jgi:hypothetical protein
MTFSATFTALRKLDIPLQPQCPRSFGLGGTGAGRSRRSADLLPHMIMPTFIYQTMLVPEEASGNASAYGSGKTETGWRNSSARYARRSFDGRPFRRCASTRRRSPHPIFPSPINAEGALEAQTFADFGSHPGWRNPWMGLASGVDHTVNTSIHGEGCAGCTTHPLGLNLRAVGMSCLSRCLIL